MEIKQLSKEIEKVSKKYAKKFGIKRDSDWYILKLQEEKAKALALVHDSTR